VREQAVCRRGAAESNSPRRRVERAGGRRKVALALIDSPIVRCGVNYTALETKHLSRLELCVGTLLCTASNFDVYALSANYNRQIITQSNLSAMCIHRGLV